MTMMKVHPLLASMRVPVMCNVPVQATVDGVLGGYGFISGTDIR